MGESCKRSPSSPSPKEETMQVHESKTGRRKFLQLIGAAGAISGMLPFFETSVAAQKHVKAQATRWTQKTSQNRGDIARSVGWSHFLGANDLSGCVRQQ
jgi:hypothetical protein